MHERLEIPRPCALRCIENARHQRVPLHVERVQPGRPAVATPRPHQCAVLDVDVPQLGAKHDDLVWILHLHIPRLPARSRSTIPLAAKRPGLGDNMARRVWRQSAQAPLPSRGRQRGSIVWRRQPSAAPEGISLQCRLTRCGESVRQGIEFFPENSNDQMGPPLQARPTWLARGNLAGLFLFRHCPGHSLKSGDGRRRLLKQRRSAPLTPAALGRHGHNFARNFSLPGRVWPWFSR